MITKTKAIEIIKSGRFFSCEFTKKDGSVRKLNGRTGVFKHLHGGSKTYNPADMGYITVFDLKERGYRTVNVQTLQRVNGKRVD